MAIVSFITSILAVLIALAVVFRRYNRLVNIVFSISMLSTAFTVFGDFMSLYQPEFMSEWKQAVLMGENIMAISWLLFSLIFARSDYWRIISKFSKLILYLSPVFFFVFLFVPMGDFFHSPEFERQKVLFLGDAGYLFYLMLLFYSILALINMEATLRSSRGADRWKIKYTIMGVGAILSIHIFYYSHALLYRSIDMNLFPVRTGIILLSVLLIGASLFRHKGLDTEFSVSRSVLYRSFSLIVVGGYLLVLGIVGEGMRYFGPTAGRNVTTFLGFVGALFAMMIIFSEPLRNKIKVVINKNFFPQKYDYREQWLQFTQQISMKHSFDELLGSIADGFIKAIGVKGAAIWLWDKGRGDYYCARSSGSSPAAAAPERNLPEFLLTTKWILDVNNPNCSEILSRNREFIERTGASLIVPLLDAEDLIGFIVLKEGHAGNDYNYEDFDLLKTLARQTSVVIMNAKLSEELTVAKEMEAVGRLSSFILHDLKNATSMLSLIVQNAEEHMDNPDFQRDAIRAISNTSEKIKGIIGKLKNLPEKARFHFEYSDLGENVKEVLRDVRVNGNSGLCFRELEPVKTRFDREEIKKVIVNLIMNALDATRNTGKVEVTVGKENNMAYVKVSDNGCGMSREFIEKRLFKPFQTTKKKGLGIGIYQCKNIIENHSGMLKVSSTEDCGTDFVMYLPVTRP